MPRIRDEFLDCVIYLYPDRSAAETGEKIGGSGFLVGVQSKGLPQNFWFLYAVTNKHVINGGATTIRFTTTDGKTDVLETDERAWVHHPSGDDLSVCLVSFDPKNVQVSFYRLALLEKAGLVDDEDRIVICQMLDDIVADNIAQGIGIQSLRPRIACCRRPPPRRASNRFCVAHRRADLPETGLRSSQRVLARTTDVSASSLPEATPAHNASVSSIDAARAHDLRIMVAHGFRYLQKGQL